MDVVGGMRCDVVEEDDCSGNGYFRNCTGFEVFKGWTAGAGWSGFEAFKGLLTGAGAGAGSGGAWEGFGRRFGGTTTGTVSGAA